MLKTAYAFIKHANLKTKQPWIPWVNVYKQWSFHIIFDRLISNCAQYDSAQNLSLSFHEKWPLDMHRSSVCISQGTLLYQKTQLSHFWRTWNCNCRICLVCPQTRVNKEVTISESYFWNSPFVPLKGTTS